MADSVIPTSVRRVKHYWDIDNKLEAGEAARTEMRRCRHCSMLRKEPYGGITSYKIVGDTYGWGYSSASPQCPGLSWHLMTSRLPEGTPARLQYFLRHAFSLQIPLKIQASGTDHVQIRIGDSDFYAFLPKKGPIFNIFNAAHRLAEQLRITIEPVTKSPATLQAGRAPNPGDLGYIDPSRRPKALASPAIALRLVRQVIVEDDPTSHKKHSDKLDDADVISQLPTSVPAAARNRKPIKRAR